MFKKINSFCFSFLGSLWPSRIPRASWTTWTSCKLRLVNKYEKLLMGNPKFSPCCQHVFHLLKLPQALPLWAKFQQSLNTEPQGEYWYFTGCTSVCGLSPFYYLFCKGWRNPVMSRLYGIGRSQDSIFVLSSKIYMVAWIIMGFIFTSFQNIRSWDHI